MGLSPQVLGFLAQEQFLVPTAIQQRLIPVLSVRDKEVPPANVVCLAETGSGKTLGRIIIIRVAGNLAIYRMSS
jgi:superfamily II DNA/RNA helicase